MNKKKVRISESHLRKLVVEELRALNEHIDHEGVKIVVTAASKLLKAVEDFNDSANSTMTNALEPDLGSVMQQLESMINNPSSYLDKPKPVKKVVHLRQAVD